MKIRFIPRFDNTLGVIEDHVNVIAGENPRQELFGFVPAVAAKLAMLVGLGVRASIGVLLGLLACMLTGKIMDIDFGPLDTACLKLAAVIVFPGAVAALLPTLAAIPVGLILYFALLAWLFDLEGWEYVVCGLVIWAMYIAAGIVATIAFAG